MEIQFFSLELITFASNYVVQRLYDLGVPRPQNFRVSVDVAVWNCVRPFPESCNKLPKDSSLLIAAMFVD